ncbi:thiol oxidoreductase [Myxococcota bacterium]|nr:thiol oxidoreductase [Myxococcota bacterium]
MSVESLVRRHVPLVLLVSALAVACSADPPPTSEPDAGTASADATASDAAEPDAAPLDAAVFEDAGAPDVEVIADAALPPPTITPLFDETTALQPALVEDTPAALISRFADRGRDRHARESQFSAYEHWLPFYWEHRTVEVEIVDTIGRGGDSITFNVTTQWKLQDRQAELRFFFRGQTGVAEYHDNAPMTPIDRLHYTRAASFNPREGRPLEVGDKMELELSQFLDAPPRGRSNYYGTTFLYVAGQGIVPWIGSGPRRDSEPLPAQALLGGATTNHANESDEPEYAFSQMATNIAPLHGQPFVRGRRVAHTSFVDGRHDESVENPVWQEQVGKGGPRSIAESCNACHLRNGRSLPPSPGSPLRQFVVKVGDATGAPHPLLGAVLQPAGSAASGEGDLLLAAWEAQGSLQKPRYSFATITPERFSVRSSPALVGLGLLEAISESDLERLADPDDADGDGISGRIHVVAEAGTSLMRAGRFGWKAGQPTVRQQVAGALRTDMGVLSSVYPTPDCGSAQTECGDDGAELDDADLDDLVVYVALLGVPPRRDLDDAGALRGEALFVDAGCAKCHVPSFVTSAYAPFAELRSQTIAPYTDLLLHDMGPGLADELAEGDASGAEWRTTPLWGLGRTGAVSGGRAYLHDGRARTLEEAIAWHGGEADASRLAFEALSAEDQAFVVRFLESL